MNDRTIMGVVIVVLLVMVAKRPAPPAPTPVPTPGIDLSGAFANKEDAGRAAALFADVAELLEFDGSQPQPLFVSDGKLHDFRAVLRTYKFRGHSLVAANPSVGPAVERFLIDRFGSEEMPIDAGRRTQWTSAYRELAAACEAAR